MKVTFTDQAGKVHKVKQPYEGASYANVDTTTCPHCKASPLQVSGTGKHIESYDTYRAAAICAAVQCSQPVGTLRVKVSTLFGLEEDERVAQLGMRIY